MQRRSFVARVIFGVTTRERVSVTLLIRLGIVGNIVVCSANGRRGIRATTCNDIVFRGARAFCSFSLPHPLFSSLFLFLPLSDSLPLSRSLCLSSASSLATRWNSTTRGIESVHFASTSTRLSSPEMYVKCKYETGTKTVATPFVCELSFAIPLTETLKRNTLTEEGSEREKYICLHTTL